MRTRNRRRKKVLVALIVLAGSVLVGLAIFAMLTDGPRGQTDDAALIMVESGTLTDIQPDDIWKDFSGVNGNGFTPRSALGTDVNSIGVLSIEKIGVSVQVYDSENTMEDMKKGASHYRASSYWDGNICFAAHIGNASYSYFDRLKELKAGDIVEYETNLGLRRYKVDDIRTISDEDWSVIERTEENRVTMTTCIDGKEDMRLCVRAIEVD